MKPMLVVFCTCPDEKAARKLASGLIEKRLAACVNVLPEIRSIYRWQGSVHEDGEALMVVKTPAAKYEKLEEWLMNHHPYELPEVIALPVDRGMPAYLDWVTQETE